MGRHKKRWGIETTFRVQDEVKIKTAVFAVIALLNRLESVLLLISPKSIRGYCLSRRFFFVKTLTKSKYHDLDRRSA
jgi:hypothetical protein